MGEESAVSLGREKRNKQGKSFPDFVPGQGFSCFSLLAPLRGMPPGRCD
jgi:hypothetical protein